MSPKIKQGQKIEVKFENPQKSGMVFNPCPIKKDSHISTPKSIQTHNQNSE